MTRTNEVSLLMGYRHIKSFDMEESVITNRTDYFEKSNQYTAKKFGI